MNEKRTIEFGALCKPLSEQIDGLDKKWDAISEAVTILMLHRIITGTEAHKARKRIIKQIEKEMSHGT